ncbi:MAG: aspartate/glutamate racemase family protein [Thermodesulfobacteriota bacterium]
MKIWYQSCTALGAQEKLAGYQWALLKHIDRVKRPDTEVHVHGTRFYTPAIDGHYYLEYFNTGHIMENALKAQDQGYDAFALGCFLDSGFAEIQEILDIPVAFSCQAALHVASLLARKFLVVVPNKGLQARVIGKAGSFGLRERLVDCRVKRFEHEKMLKAIDDAGVILKELDELVEDDSDAEMIVPGENILNIVLAENNVKTIKGLPVLDITGCLIKVAEMLADMKALGIAARRRAGYAPTLARETLLELGRAYQEARDEAL